MKVRGQEKSEVKGGGGGGGGFTLFFFVKLDQQTKTHDQTFEGVRTRVPTGAGGTATHLFRQFLAQFC